MPKRTFKVGENTYDIEDKDVNAFLSDMPDAIEFKSFIVDKDTFDIPLPDVDAFLKDKPSAKLTFQDNEKKKPTQTFSAPFSQGVGASVKMPSQLKSPSISTPTSTTTTTPKQKKVAELPKYDPTSRIKLYTETSQRIQQRIPQLVEAFNVAEQSGNAEEAARLQELINVDSERLNMFEQGIKMQKDLAKKNEASSLAIGLDNVMGGLMAGVNFLEEAQQNIFADLTGIRLSEETLKGIDEVNKKIGTVRPSDALAKAGKEILEKSKIKTEEKTMNMPYQGGVWEALKKGDVKAASSNAGTHFVMSLPQSVLMANPITGSLLSAGMAQQSVDEERAAGNNVTSSDYMVGAAKAATEYVFENMFGTGKALKEMVQALGNDAARKAIEKTAKAGLKEWAKKVGANITEETFGEGLTQISQNLIDIANGKKVGVLDGVADAALIGLFGGMTQGTATTTITHYVDRAKLKEYEVKKEKAIQLQEQALEAPSEVVAEAIEVQAAKINAEADAIAEENNEIGANADPEIIAELEQENADLDELEAALPEAPPEVQEAIQAQIDEKTKVVEKLTKQARLSALERLKIAEEEIKPQPQENEEATITAQEKNVEPMLGGVQTDRNEVKGGETSPELRASQEDETQEVKPKDTLEGIKPTETEQTIPEKVQTEDEKKVEELRAAEQAEYDAMPDPNDEAAREEIYDRYNKLITPLLGKEEAGSVGVGGDVKSDELIVKKYADKEIKRQLDEQGYETKNKTAKELRDLYKKEVGTDEYKEPPRNNYKLKVVSKKQVGGTDFRLGANSSDRSIRNNTERYGEPIFDENTNEYVWKTNTRTLWEMEDVETGKKYSVFGNKEYPFSDIEQGQPPNYGYIEKPKFKNGDIFEVSANPEINEKYGNTTLKNVRKQAKAVEQSLKEMGDGVNDKGVPFIKKIFDKIRSITKLNKVQHNRLFNIDTKLSKEIADAYEKMKHDPNNPKVKKAYEAMVEETKQQYNALVDGGLKAERWTGEGEPYANSAEMLNDLKENNHLWFLPNESAFGDKGAATKYKDNIGLQDSGITLDGKPLTNSEVFRIVHDAVHGINGSEFGAIGEENATLQHLSMYSEEALPAVVAQTRGQNSWVNFSGVNDSANAKFKEAAKLDKEGEYDKAKKIRKEAQKEFTFAEPKIGLLPNKYNFRYYGTKNSELASKERTNTRSGEGDTRESKPINALTDEKNLARESQSFSSRSNSRGRTIRTSYGDVVPKAIHTVKQSLIDGINKVFPNAAIDKELFEVDADIFHKAALKAKSVNKYGAAVNILSPKEYSNYRLFITEDGLTGIALSPMGDLGSGFDMSGKSRRLVQLLVLGIENEATRANAFDTILPDYYSAFGFKPVARNLWNDALKSKDWNYTTFEKWNNGRPDVVHFVWDGGDRNNIHERIGQFDNYSEYHKEQTPIIDTWEEAQEIVEQSLKETPQAGSVGVGGDVVKSDTDKDIDLLNSNPKTRSEVEEIVKKVMREDNFKDAIRRIEFLASGALTKHYNNDFSYLKDAAKEIERLKPKPKPTKQPLKEAQAEEAVSESKEQPLLTKEVVEYDGIDYEVHHENGKVSFITKPNDPKKLLGPPELIKGVKQAYEREYVPSIKEEPKSEEVTPAEVEVIKEQEKSQVKKQVKKAIQQGKPKSISEWKKATLETIDKVVNLIIDNHTSDSKVKEMFISGDISLDNAIDNDSIQLLKDNGFDISEKGQLVIKTPQGELKLSLSGLLSTRKEVNKLSDSSVISNEATRLPSRPKKVDAQVAATEFYEPESKEDAKFELDSSKEVLDNSKKSNNKKLVELAQLQYDFYKDWYENFDTKLAYKIRLKEEYERTQKAIEKKKKIEGLSKELNALLDNDYSVFKEAGITDKYELYDFLEALGIEEIPTKMSKELYANLFAKAAMDRKKYTYLTYQASLKDRIQAIPKLTAKSSWKKQSEAKTIEKNNESIRKLIDSAEKYSEEATKIFKELNTLSNADKAINFLDSLKIRAKGRAFGILPPFAIPIGVWNTTIDTIILGVKAGRVISEVVQEAIDYIKANHGKFDEKAFKDMLIEGGVATQEEIEGVSEGVSEEVPPIEPPPSEPKKEEGEGKQKKSGFQERSIEQAEDEVVKQIARDNEVYYTTMNQKEEYERAKKEFPDAQSVSDNIESLFPENVKLEDAARLQVRRQVAMQVLSIEVSKQLAMGKDPKELGNKINRIQNALAVDFAKGGQIGAMAVWRFMTPEGIVYQVTQKIKEQNQKIEENLTEGQKEELANLQSKIDELQVKLQEEIDKSAERKEKKAQSKPQKEFSEAKKKRKEELKEILRKKMFGQFNDISNIARILFDKDTIEYAKLVVEEGAVDFNTFAKEMVKDLGKAIKPILPELYKKVTGEDLLDAESKKQMEDYLQKQFTNAYGKSKIPSKKTPKRDLDRILEGIGSGILDDSFYKKLFLEKFGIRTNITIAEAAKLRELANAVTSLPPTSKLYNIAVLNMAQYINNLYPRQFFSDLADTWVALNYAQMLSGVSTHILNIFSTGFGIVNSPFRNALNLSKWLKAIREGVKEQSFATFLAYNPVYESYFVPAAWVQGAKIGKDIAMDTLMSGATTDKYIEGLVNQSGKVKVSTLEQERYGKGKRYKPLRIFGIDLNLYNKAKYVGRSLAAEDAFMFQTAYEAELAGLALSIYREKGLRGKALTQAVKNAYMLQNVNMEAINEQLDAEVAILEASGIKVNERVKKIRRSELMADRVIANMGATQEQKQGITKLASSSTFTDDRNGVISKIANAIGAISNKNRATQVLIKPFVPFTKVVANVTETALDAAPIYGFLRANGIGVTGLINKILKVTGNESIATSAMGEKNTQEYYEQMARAWQGTIAFATLFLLFGHSGDEDEDYEDSFLQLTGGYSEETRKNRIGRQKVTPKYTIRIGDYTMSYLNMPVLQIPLGIIGNYNDYKNANRYNKEELEQRTILSLAYAGAQTMTMIKDMSFVQGVEDLTKLIYEIFSVSEKETNKFGKTLYEKYSSFLLKPLPQNNNMLLQIQKFFDPISYSRKEISDITMYSLGLQHIYGKPSVDIFGDAVKSYPSETVIPYTHWFNLNTADRDWKFLSKYNAIQPKLKNTPTKIYNSETGEYEVRTMTSSEFYDFNVLAGKIFRKKVQNYQELVNPDERVKETIEVKDKKVNALDNDISRLHWAAKEEAKASLFLAKNVNTEVLAKFFDAQDIVKKERKEAKRVNQEEVEKKLIESDRLRGTTDEQKRLREAINQSTTSTNVVPLILEYFELNQIEDFTSKKRELNSLVFKKVITNEQEKQVKEIFGF